VIRRLTLSTLGASGFLVILVVIFFIFQSDEEAPLQVSTPISSSQGFWEVYFSDPENPASKSYRGGPDVYLVEAIDSAQYSIDMAMYHLDLWSVRDALIYAQRRGLQVRVVTDSAYRDELEIRALQEAGISVIEDRRPSLMHHKFLVIDRSEVWTGSMNLTVNGAYRNDNHLLRINAKEVAENYVREFEEMFEEDTFGAASLPDTPYPVLSIDGKQVEVLFSPEDGVLDRLLKYLRESKESVIFLAYSFTTDTLGETLLDLHQGGIDVRGVVEQSQISATGSETVRLREAGLDIQLDANPANMHHKVFIIDREIVLLGSYNFTRSAEEKNDENVLIIHDPALAAHFLLEFERIYRLASP
jgi:phosphatidylserine/phosphatidylglycerophosphate/cardiolipin synthase-like enzyme